MYQKQRILSFDIGIKNMALCMFSLDLSNNIENIHNKNIPFEISQWTVLNLMDEQTEIKYICTQCISKKTPKTSKNINQTKKQKKIVTIDTMLGLDNNMNHILEKERKYEGESKHEPLSNNNQNIPICGKYAKYKKKIETNETLFFCEKCAKNQTRFLIPKKTYQSTSLKKLKIEDLEKLSQEFSIESRESKKTKKSMVEILSIYFQNNCLETVVEQKRISAGDTDLITIGRNMVRLLDEISNIYAVDIVLIENQISTIATRMKSVQGMLAQYFIIRNPGSKIEFISSSNKLKGLVLENTEKQVEHSEKTETQQKQNYKKHKTDGVQITREILEKNPWLESNIQILSQSKKKDDLADAFLQGIWYLRKTERIQMDDSLKIV